MTRPRCGVCFATDASTSLLPKLQHVPSDAEKHPELLLAHGTGDDNVHFLNSANALKHLIAAGVDVSFMAFPNAQHSISANGAHAYIYRLLYNFMQRV